MPTLDNAFLNFLLTWLPGLFVLLVFGIGAALMITKRLPALLTLPLMAIAVMIGMTFYGNIPYFLSEDITEPIISASVWGETLGGGVKLLAGAMVIAFLGGALSFQMQKSGVAEQLIKNGAELIGDNPVVVAISCLILVGLMFTTLGGLGAVIMVSIVLMPMMATVGIPPIVIAGIMVIGISLGGSMNAGNWVRFVDTMGIPYSDVRDFAYVVFVHVLAAGICFITIEMWRAGALKSTAKMISTVIITCIVAMAIVLLIWKMSLGDDAASADEGVPPVVFYLRIIIGAWLALLHIKILLDIYKRIPRWRHQIVEIKWFAFLIPVIPLIYIMVFDLDPYLSFMLGIVYAMMATARPGSVSLTIQSLIQGGAAVMPAVILFMGIGMVIFVFRGPFSWDSSVAEWPTVAALNPYFFWLKPTPWMFVIFFAIIAPGALYRGPLNTWGLGFGVAAILIDSVGFSAPVIMGMLLMTGQIQGVCDPTNTDNVWISNELRVDVQQLMLRTLPYFWVMAILGLFTTVLFFRDEFTQEQFMEKVGLAVEAEEAEEVITVEESEVEYMVEDAEAPTTGGDSE